MSPFLVFLNAARNLASMGMKREQVLDFAQREFGELTELMKAQIDNIYKPKKGAPSESKVGEFFGFKNYPKKDEVFDDTVVKMKFDDEGKPFNPRDPLKNLSKKDKDKKADGGRIGLKDGLFPFPMKQDGFLRGIDFDKLTDEQKAYMEGMKIQEKKRQKKLREFLDKLKESQPEGSRGLKPVPFPDRPIPDSVMKGLASGGRVGFKKGLLASMMEGLSPDGGIFQSIFANRKHPILSTFNATELLSIGEALGPLIGFNEGGRVGLKDGMDRRKFLKIMGGLASLPIVGKFLKFAKPAAPAAQKVMENFSSKASEAPTYFFDLITKIKAFGKQSKVGPSERVDEYTYIGKNGDEYTLTEDIATGDAQIVKDKMGIGSSGDKTFDTINDRTVMEYKAPKKDVDPDTQKFIDEGAEYEEYKVEFDMDGTEAGADAIEETIQKEIIEEATKSAPPIKKAAGGLAYMLGE